MEWNHNKNYSQLVFHHECTRCRLCLSRWLFRWMDAWVLRKVGVLWKIINDNFSFLNFTKVEWQLGDNICDQWLLQWETVCMVEC